MLGVFWVLGMGAALGNHSGPDRAAGLHLLYLVCGQRCPLHCRGHRGPPSPVAWSFHLRPLS